MSKLNKKFIVEFIRQGVKHQTDNLLCETNPKAWIRKKLLETYKDYDSIPAKFKQEDSLKAAFIREYQSNLIGSKNDIEKAIELSISNIRVSKNI